ncbi:hypothetical protein [Hydrocarboniphaga sp.]|uniref:hypothetical protein n=1 Tax=Hydrocarboniphaga sp. TaxID=2033016 RepID=UPI003D0C61AC
MEDDFAPDRADKIIRFLCGLTIIGGTSLLFIAVTFPAVSAKPLWCISSVIGVISGVCALRFGDNFWLKISGIFH